MDAIVTAGGVPAEGDPLYEFTQGGSKALLDLAGKAMAQWVLDALSNSESIENIALVGLTEDSGLVSSKPMAYLPNQGSMLDNIVAGAHKLMDITPGLDVVLTVSSDIPAITAEMIDWMSAEVVNHDSQVYYNVVTQEDMENRFPGSKRSFTRFKDASVCGGDMTAFRTDLITGENSLWQKIIEARKNVFKQAALIGYDTLLLLLLRRLTIDSAVERAGRSLEVTAKALRCPYPEIAMDVDKPFQFELLRAELAERST